MTSTSSPTFDGIPQDAVTFYRELAADNSKVWWEANKARYAGSVREPLEHLLDGLEAEFGPANLFRPYRDVRFSKDKTPIKDAQGAFVQTAAGMGWYVRIGADGLMTGGGFHAHAPDQVARFREAVDDEASGRVLVRIVDTLVGAGFDVGGETLKTRPRGIPEDHPRLDLLRHKSLTVGRGHGIPDWLNTPAVRDHVRADWEAMRPLVDWLGQWVGPSTQPAQRGRPR